MTTPAAFTPALVACATTSSSEAAATFAIAATSSRRAISPMLKINSTCRRHAREGGHPVRRSAAVLAQALWNTGPRLRGGDKTALVCRADELRSDCFACADQRHGIPQHARARAGAHGVFRQMPAERAGAGHCVKRADEVARHRMQFR